MDLLLRHKVVRTAWRQMHGRVGPPPPPLTSNTKSLTNIANKCCLAPRVQCMLLIFQQVACELQQQQQHGTPPQNASALCQTAFSHMIASLAHDMLWLVLQQCYCLLRKALFSTYRGTVQQRSMLTSSAPGTWSLHCQSSPLRTQNINQPTGH